MHHFHSNSSVTINAVTQDTGVIKGEVYSAKVGEMAGGIDIQCTFLKDDEDGAPVHHSSYRVTEADMDVFEGTVTLTETGATGRFQELCTRYVLAQVEGMWGLTSSDWTLEAH